MAIIRSKIARQLLAEGGAPRRKGFMFGSGPGSTAESLSQAADDLNTGSNTFGGFSGDYGGFSSPAGGSGPAPGSDPNTMDDTADVNLGLDVSRQPAFTPPDPDSDTSFFSNPRKALEIKYIENELDRRKNFDKTLAGKLGFTPNEIPFDDKFLSRTQELEAALNLAKRGINVTDIIQKGRPGYDPDRTGDSEPVIKLRAPITEKIEEEKPKKSEIENLLAFRGSAFEDGGEVRQKFGLGGLGKVFKKAKNVVKKVVKSPIGKAALIGGLGYLGATKTKFGGELFTKFADLGPLQKALLIGGVGLSLSPFAMKEEDEDETLPEVNNTDPAFTNLINYMGGPTRFAADGGDIDEAPMKMASAPDPAADRRDVLEELSLKYYKKPLKDLTPDEFLDLENAIDEMSKKQGIKRAEAAGGGMMNPNDEMLDLGGNEMDLRGGGFVPLGEYEKKDDVPARLSKNEFVFTADAVRAAGGGSVDRGADLMYKTMKQLENKVV